MSKPREIEVEIMPDGVSAKELNPHEDMSMWDKSVCVPSIEVLDKWKAWKRAEQARTVYKIDHVCDENVCMEIRESWKPSCKIKPGSIHTAIVVDEVNKIVKIV